METTEKSQMEMLDIKKKCSSTNEDSICGLYNRLAIARPIDGNYPNKRKKEKKTQSVQYEAICGAIWSNLSYKSLKSQKKRGDRTM